MADPRPSNKKEILVVSVIGLDCVALDSDDGRSLSVYFLISQGAECYQSSVRDASHDVIWNETFQFQVPPQSTPLRIALMQDGSTSVHKVLAEASISLQKLKSAKRMSEWFNMYGSGKSNPKTSESQSTASQSLKARVNLSLSIGFKQISYGPIDLPGHIDCVVISCLNLDATGSRHPNAYCHIQLDQQVFQTKLAPISDHISWNHQSTLKAVHRDSKLTFDVRSGPLSLGVCEIPVLKIIKKQMISQKIDICASAPGERSRVTGSLNLQLKYTYIPQEARSFLQNDILQMPTTIQDTKHFNVERPKARSLIIEVTGWKLLVSELAEGLQPSRQKHASLASVYCIVRIQDREFRTTTVSPAHNVEWPSGEGMILNWNGTSALVVEVWSGISPEFKKIASAQLIPQQISARFDSSQLEWTPTIDIHLRKINGYVRLKISDRESVQDTRPNTEKTSKDGKIGRSTTIAKAYSQAIPASVAGSAVVIKLIQAKSLIPKNSEGSHSYYCIAALGGRSVKTATSEGKSSPIWNEDLVIPVEDSGDVKSAQLTISILDEIQMGEHDTIGEIQIPLHQIKQQQMYDRWHYLDDQSLEGNTSASRVHVVVEYAQKYSGISRLASEAIQGSDVRVGLLEFDVVSARNICDPSEGSPNCFCRIKHGKYTFDTQISERTRNPIWKETHSFPIKSPKGLLTIEIITIVPTKEEHVMGNTTIRLSSLVKQEKVRDWFPLTGKKSYGSSPASTLSRGDILLEFRFGMDKTQDVPRNPLDHGVHWPSTLRQAVKFKATNQNQDELPVLHKLETILSNHADGDALELRFENLRDSGAERIAMHLIRKPSITTLCLCGNKITDSGLASLVAALRGNNRLELLDMSFNMISDEGVRILSSLFKENKYIRIIDLAANNIGTRGVSLLKQAAEHAKQPCLIHLRGNGGLPESQIHELAQVLQANQRHLYWDEARVKKAEDELSKNFRTNKMRSAYKESAPPPAKDAPLLRNVRMDALSEYREFLEILGINPEIQRRFLDPKVKAGARPANTATNKSDSRRKGEIADDESQESDDSVEKSSLLKKTAQLLHQRPTQQSDDDDTEEKLSDEQDEDEEEDEDNDAALSVWPDEKAHAKQTELNPQHEQDSDSDDVPPWDNVNEETGNQQYCAPPDSEEENP